MEYTVYTVLADRGCIEYDSDRIPYDSGERFFEDMFASKKEAIRKAQRIIAKQPLNDYVSFKHVRVISQSITDKGMSKKGKLIYRIYKSQE